MTLPRRRSRRALLGAATAVLLGAAVAGCSSSGPGPGSDAGASPTGELTVLAAASLTEPFTELAEAFEADHPGTTVRLAFDSSATLAEQVRQGAPADVLATADERTMQVVVDAAAIGSPPEVFASNRLALVVPAENPAGLGRFADLDRSGVDYVVCVDSAPCGALARAALDGSDVSRDPASEEVDVKAVLAKVLLDEADAGIVYASDAVAAGDRVRSLPVPGSADTTTRYPVAVLADAEQPALARAWVDLLLSGTGRQVLDDAGFGPP